MEYKTKILDPRFREQFVKEMELRFLATEESKDFSCMETIMDICELFEVEPESVSSLIIGPFKAKLKEEAVGLNMIKCKKRNKLPLE